MRDFREEGDPKERFIQKIAEILSSEDLCLESELKLRMERFNYYEDYTGRLLKQLSDEGKIRVGNFNLYSGQTEPSRYYYRSGLSQPERQRVLIEKVKLYLSAIKMHSQRSHSADFLEALIFLSLVKVKRLHPKLCMTIYRPHDQIDWLNGHEYRFDDFFSLTTGNYGVQIRNSLHMLFLTSTDLQTFFQTTTVCRPVLVNRLSSKELKVFLLRNKGRALDMKKVVICTADNPSYDKQPFIELEIDHVIKEVPHLLHIGNENLTGTEFFEERKYAEYTFEELSIAAERNVPQFILEKTIGLVRVLHTTNLVDLATISVRNKGEALIGAILTSASYNYLLASNKRRIHVDSLYNYSKPFIRPPLRFYLQRIGDREAKNILVEHLRRLAQIKLLSEPKRFEFQITDATHPEEWLSY